MNNADDAVLLSMPQIAALRMVVSNGKNPLRRPLSMYISQSANEALLMTTRTRGVATKLAKPPDVILVDSMAKIDAVALLKKKLDTTNINSDLRELASMLEYISLAIV